MSDTPDTPPTRVKKGNYEPAEMNAAIEHAITGRCECTHKFYQAHEYEGGSVQATGTITISPEQFARWLESDACKQWRETTIAGLKTELAKAREKIRRLEARKKDAAPEPQATE